MSEVSILKLRDGATLVGKVTYDGEKFLIEHPIEMVSNAGFLKQGLGEAINLKPWVSIADEQVFTIERENIITVATLQEKFVNGYHDMVQAIYFQDPLWAGDFVDPPQEQQDENVDLDTLTELADAILKNKLH
tara:strand:- start:2231 stop:2629 length:399 start_codon:yes stop_codon:yes gene_type:complete